MKRILKKTGLFSVTIVLAVFLALCFGGCVGFTSSGTKMLTSYVSTDSTVQSSTADVVAKVAESVVEIRTESVNTQWGMQYVVSGAGSGVIVAHDDGFGKYYIITNNHVIEGASNITVTLRSGTTYSASLIAADKSGDIAVLEIAETKTLNVAVWGNSSDLRIGEDLIAIGNPLGSLGGTVTKGILSATERSISVGDYTMTLLQTDTAINPGNSGGGLFNMKCELVGIVNAKTSDEEVEGICFAIPADTARDIFNDLVQNGVVTGRVSLGIEVASDTYNHVIYVNKVSDVEKNTFKLYDRIVSIGNKQITTVLGFNDAIAALKPGDKTEVTVYRGTVSGRYVVYDTVPTTFTVTAKQLGA